MATRCTQVTMKKTQHTQYGLRSHKLDSVWHAMLALAVLIAMVAFSTGARAAEETEARSELWVDTGFWSHHTNQRKGRPYREHNVGAGLEWHFKSEWQINLGRYRNSLDAHSNYLQAGWMPLEWTPVGEFHIKAGASLGVV